MAEEFIMTQKGYDEAKEYLNYLQTEKRKEITERIKVARGFGDLSENAEYDAAKNEEALNESEIRELENKIKNAKIMEESTDNSMVHFGNVVTVSYFDEEDGDLEETYTLMGSTEADPENNVISIDSPFGSALIGAKCGDTVTVHSPRGDYQVKILAIK
ncbi:MAG TPA: transcription elongation factor GreA [Candidatus Borkfalkia excrementavium]|uniref:Transcription elongation factor GreA n=1 Tax=Candidatus Borkfalkia excrementavium TaxID=2838505 RepID=A0A9D2CFU9_9FIRM|nr:transcription elongation factor GreA [Candidatus Borkfalkia excrementavium]